MRGGGAARTPVTIVCVFNDPEVLDLCLARSVTDGLADAPETEFIPVDNRGNGFDSAGAALNHGARNARNDVVVFVHQDVVLHSLVALEEAAASLLAEPSIGILGAIGMDAGDHLVGRIRDRVVRVGESAREPRDVHSLDEVLFLITRDRLHTDPLSEDALLSWHAYGVEYCARMRHAGLRAAAVDIPLTHNSLTTNLKDLDLAHAHVGEMYPSLLPLRTTCGTIWRGGGPRGIHRLLHYAHRARIWLAESAGVRALSRVTSAGDTVIADIRLLIDEALSRGDMSSLRVIDLDVDDSAARATPSLTRFGRAYSASSATLSEARAMVDERDAAELLLVTARDRSALASLGPLHGVPHVAGHTHDTGVWIAIGVPALTLRPLWSTRRNRPIGELIAPRRAVARIAA